MLRNFGLAVDNEDKTQFFLYKKKEDEKMNNYSLKNNLLDIFYRANSKFLEREMHNILNDVSERSLCSSLSQHLFAEIDHSIFSKYYVDTEYNRNGTKVKTIINYKEEIIKITCDLILHSRGENKKDNLLALEMKKSSNPNKDDDKKRLIALTKRLCKDVWFFESKDTIQAVCDYEIGIFYEINLENKEITLEIYSEGKLFGKETNSFQYYINYLKNAESRKKDYS